LIVRPEVHMPALTKSRMAQGGLRGKNFSVLLYHHCVRAISVPFADFHGHTENIQRESHARFIGYGAMLLESFVASWPWSRLARCHRSLFRD